MRGLAWAALALMGDSYDLSIPLLDTKETDMSKDKQKKAQRNDGFKDGEIARLCKLNDELSAEVADLEDLQGQMVISIGNAVEEVEVLEKEVARLQVELLTAQDCAQNYLKQLDTVRANLGIALIPEALHQIQEPVAKEAVG